MFLCIFVSVLVSQLALCLSSLHFLAAAVVLIVITECSNNYNNMHVLNSELFNFIVNLMLIYHCPKQLLIFNIFSSYLLSIMIL